jgi:oligoribonuclease NrnB/cAMP/cGMP phosphodiesterase (DHH superfamily)
MKPEEITVVVYHVGCLDGVAAVHIAGDYFKQEQGWFIGYNPNQPPISEFDGFCNKDIAFFDCAPTKELLAMLRSKGNRVMVIDHHIHNERALEGEPGCFFTQGRAGCQLAWDYYHPNEPIPELYDLIGQGDLWDFSNEKTKYLRLALIERKASTMQGFLEIQQLPVDQLVGEGLLIETHLENLKKEVIYRLVDIDQVPVITGKVAGYKFISELADHALATFPTGKYCVMWYPEKDGYKLSLRTAAEDVDVSVIAAKFAPNGGGHRKAAGCFVKELPWQETVDIV